MASQDKSKVHKLSLKGMRLSIQEGRRIGADGEAGSSKLVSEFVSALP